MGLSAVALLLLSLPPVAAQVPRAESGQLTLDRIFASEDFAGDAQAAIKWLEGGSYTTLEPSKTMKGAQDIVRHDGTGRRDVLVAAEKLVPPGAKEPLAIEDYECSKNLDVVLIYTKSAKVWRVNTRGDYWTLRRSTGKLVRQGGNAKPSTLMFAKLSADGTRVGYVHDNNLFVQAVEGGDPTMLTHDGSDAVINGTFDWVYEEEFFCRDGWRWSPDGKRIAFWQIDTRGVKTFTLVDNLSGTYPVLKTFAYPKTGERNSACRIGVVDAAGGMVQWIAVPGDTRTDFYVPRVEWADNSQNLVIQQVNRLQNALDVMLADATTGSVQTLLTERDGAWVDIHDDAVEWIDKGNNFTWISERDGWRHLYLVGRDGSELRPENRCRGRAGLLSCFPGSTDAAVSLLCLAQWFLWAHAADSRRPAGLARVCHRAECGAGGSHLLQVWLATARQPDFFTRPQDPATAGDQ